MSATAPAPIFIPRRPQPLPVILILAAALRIIVGLAVPNYIVPDEIYQYLGPAHRLVFGHGYIPWEFHVGLRSWLIPFLLAAPMALARLVDPSPAFGLALIRVLLSLASLSLVACATLWGQRLEGRRGAWIAGLAVALWPDLWVMAPHPLEGVLASYVLLPALFLIEPGDAPQTPRRVAIAAALLGLAFVLRNPLAPAIAVAGIALCRADRKRWLIGLAAGAIPVILAGLLDWMTWGTPFRSFWLNFVLNGLDHVATVFGRKGPGFYPLVLLVDWLWAVPAIILAVALGARRLPITTLAAGAMFLTYAAIDHKEFRFLFPMIALLAPVAGIGLARLSRRIAPWKTTAIALAALAGMLVSPRLQVELANYVSSSRAEMALQRLHPRTVGVANRAVPSNLYLGAHTTLAGIPASHDVAGLDALIIPRDTIEPPPAYQPVGCFGPINGPMVAALVTPSMECAWIATTHIPPARIEPFGGFMIFPRTARRYNLDTMDAMR